MNVSFEDVVGVVIEYMVYTEQAVWIFFLRVD